MSTIKARPPSGIALSKNLLALLGPDKRLTISDVAWEDYERFAAAIGEGSNLRVAFDGKDIEIMTTGPYHEHLRGRLEAFIAVVAGELNIDREAFGQTTWSRPEVNRGVESDLCYYFDPAKLAASTMAGESNSVSDYPNPDLAIEIDLSPSTIARPGIYKALQVPEIWCLRKRLMSIELLRPDGYVASAASRYIYVRPDEVVLWSVGEEAPARGLGASITRMGPERAHAACAGRVISRSARVSSTWQAFATASMDI